jgi:hypothetical protein
MGAGRAWQLAGVLRGLKCAFACSHDAYGRVEARKRCSVSAALQPRTVGCLFGAVGTVTARAWTAAGDRQHLPHETARTSSCQSRLFLAAPPGRSRRGGRWGQRAVGGGSRAGPSAPILSRQRGSARTCPLADHHKIAVDLTFPQRTAAKHDEGEGAAVRGCRAEASSCGAVRVSGALQASPLQCCRQVSGRRRRAVGLAKAGPYARIPTLEASRSTLPCLANRSVGLRSCTRGLLVTAFEMCMGGFAAISAKASSYALGP